MELPWETEEVEENGKLELPRPQFAQPVNHGC